MCVQYIMCHLFSRLAFLFLLLTHANQVTRKKNANIKSLLCLAAAVVLSTFRY